ncbi:MAG: hypothetical protein D8M58_07455 [Calditrichaeota bacterium]|nr:MAG: hypothetical protein DWQ03_19035 [Calditrichota bacterium]MBL1205217.1 hypothetical protein [Calditrichota bacterium]NOG45046.1 hypothetical protein [Calditrichota bacterium]
MKAKRKLVFSLFICCICFSNNIYAQDSTKSKEKKVQHNSSFVDKDGDGYNDNAPDHDGDGIPNGLDPDWQKLKKEKSNQKGKRRFVDLDGDGVDDNLESDVKTMQKMDNQLNKNGSALEGNNNKNSKGTKQKRQGKDN